MRLGDFVPPIPSSSLDMAVFPGVPYQNSDGTYDAGQNGVWATSIGQEAGRFNMEGPLPGRYYTGALAPNSGLSISVARAVAADVTQSAATGAAIAPFTLTSPMPSATSPRVNQINPPMVAPCGVGQWVSSNPLVAVAAAVGLYLVVRGSK